jgi:hypothetical protein
MDGFLAGIELPVNQNLENLTFGQLHQLGAGFIGGDIDFFAYFHNVKLNTFLNFSNLTICNAFIANQSRY